MKEAQRMLESKGYHISNQFDGFFGTRPNEYELMDAEGTTVMDHLSEAQVIDLANIL